ncbi:hypothetical protein I5H64_gp052 [Mycobacterium phage MinionDave]|uniref:Uncharacterized protein n=2 Tax=Cheoctovirus TaxID=1623281 RepID=A0A0A0RQ84_9CAUD|nr:hypothetical protein AVV73_gp050 [Mycobacterium phage CaptainTrips]YP_009959822.1 hypothetical protein I5H64_gp052 [Mycobacterium phage MinionDave]AIW02442.1 hypothetical protein PBI_CAPTAINTRIPS_50 [Mycobacterium phage CaptainTrips]QGH78837.1 hypothetical protein SEA_MINIONDAVE_52 [Mycobacterium phage MinionDave]
MNLVDRLNARFNNVIHDGLALVGAVVDPWLAKLERQAMSNALGRDFGLDYADGLAAAEAEEEVHEPGWAQVIDDAYWCFEHKMARGLCRDMHQAAWKLHASAGHRVSADPSPVSVGDIRPGAGMVPPPPAPGRSNGWDELHKQEPNSPKWMHDAIDSTKQYCLSFAREFLDDDEFMELGEFLDSVTAEELAAMRQQHATAAELERHLRYFTTAPGASGVNPGVVAQSLLENYRITPR